jgi:hypothetical protein
MAASAVVARVSLLWSPSWHKMLLQPGRMLGHALHAQIVTIMYMHGRDAFRAVDWP